MRKEIPTMPKVVKSSSLKKIAPVAARSRSRRYSAKELREMSASEYARLAPKSAGTRILTRAEVMARNKPPAPGEPTAHDALSEFMRPIREYNIWAAKNIIGHEEEMDQSLLDERNA